MNFFVEINSSGLKFTACLGFLLLPLNPLLFIFYHTLLLLQTRNTNQWQMKWVHVFVWDNGKQRDREKEGICGRDWASAVIGRIYGADLHNWCYDKYTNVCMYAHVNMQSTQWEKIRRLLQHHSEQGLHGLGGREGRQKWEWCTWGGGGGHKISHKQRGRHCICLFSPTLFPRAVHESHRDTVLWKSICLPDFLFLCIVVTLRSIVSSKKVLIYDKDNRSKYNMQFSNDIIY